AGASPVFLFQSSVAILNTSHIKVLRRPVESAEYPGGGMPAEAPVPLPAGRWRVRATQTWVGEENWVGLVQLLPAES
ncbi:hypothetical protein AB0N09_28265, partial [Streptomyces erythrochromogenes]